MKRKILKVPKIKQLPVHCGPASLSMILAYYRRNIDQKDLAVMANLDPQDGVYPPNLVRCARNLGYIARSFQGLSIPQIIQIVDTRIPLITRIKSKKEGYGHMVVVKGYDLEKRTLYINDPNESKTRRETFDSFKKQWEVDNYKERKHWITKNYAISVRPR